MPLFGQLVTFEAVQSHLIVILYQFKGQQEFRISIDTK